MKVRIRFSKSGALVYIGHLDVMRYFQKLFRRAGIPVAYSEGFSPHQILSFTPPLPLGMESIGEYADITLTEIKPTNEALEALRKESVPEINILSFKELLPDAQNAMASVTAARYTVRFNNKEGMSDTREKVNDFLSQEEVIITKKTKKGEREVNIRPLVYELTFDNGSDILEMLISSGSTDNIKPEHVLMGLNISGNNDYATDDLEITRIDQYTTGESGFISLDDLGHDII